MANNNERDTYHQVPASKYWYLGDTIGAVPKNFFKIWSPFCFFSGIIITAITLLTDWWLQLLNILFLGKLWYIGWFGTPIIIGVIYFWGHRKQKQFAKERRMQAYRRKVEAGLIRIGQEPAEVKKKQ